MDRDHGLGIGGSGGTAVEAFARSRPGLDAGLARYSALMPAGPPGPGTQYAFEVDLDRCSGCKACVTACHALNGLGDGESWRDVGLLVGGGRVGLPVLQHVTASCHHCLDPACLAACPVDAYEKDPVTGIVRHLDDQCFGCQYCTLACPYDAPKYQPSLGIVRKCDLCADRLAAGEPPACVRACPHEAIRVRVVAVDAVADRCASGSFLPGAFDPSHTRPTTRYRSARPLGPGAEAADHHRVEPEHAHPPLTAMLVLTQLWAGAFLLEPLAGGLGINESSRERLLFLGFALGQLGLAASLAHLGRPQFAYRALIGLRHSWLSREVAAFGLFAALAGARVALGPALSIPAALAGLAGVLASAMVYHAVRRPLWHAARVIPTFAATAAVLGLATAWAASGGRAPAAIALAAATVGKLVLDASVLIHLRDAGLTPLRRSACLLVGRLARPALARVALGLAGGVALPLGWPGSTPAAALALALVLAGELIERHLFFAAVTRPKMPGT